jgi:hypothetical protein
MNPETKPLPPSQEKSIGCIETATSEPALIQFIGRRHTYSFPKSDFRQSEFALTERQRQHPHRPPQELRFYGSGVTFTLTGWRLDLLPELLANGKVNSVRAEDRLPADLVFKEPLVCCIHIFWRSSAKSITLLPSKPCPESIHLHSK